MKISKYLKVILIIVLIFLIYIFLEKTRIISFLKESNNSYYVILLAKQHVYMVIVSMFLTILLGLSIGIFFTRKTLKKFSPLIIYIASLGQAIPVLAILAFIMVLYGIGFMCAVFALIICSIMPIIRNTIVGINNVNPTIINAAEGLGLSNTKILFEIELPNSLPIIITGIRTALIINISTASLGSLIGAGGFGELIFAGIHLMDTARLLIGGILATSLALLADYISIKCYNFIAPKGIRHSD